MLTGEKGAVEPVGMEETTALADISEGEQLSVRASDVGCRATSAVDAVGAVGTVGTVTTSGGGLLALHLVGTRVAHFKPVLCVENGFVSGGGKPTQLLIEAAPTQQAVVSGVPPPPPSWSETAALPVLPVRCKNTSAELHKARFGSGGRGRCIKFGGAWYTPSEFEAACGRASSKDWKRSIRFGGQSLQILIDEGVLAPHATSCTCSACCDDNAASGPVRLFVPYKRRRRHGDPPDSDVKAEKRARCNGSAEDSDNDPLNAQDHSAKEVAWQNLTNGLDASSDYPLMESDQNGCIQVTLSEQPPAVKRLDDLNAKIKRLYDELMKCFDEVRDVASEVMQQEREADLLASDVEAQASVEQNTLQNIENTTFKKCANCNRDASAECSLCRQTPYCSTFCQKKDWGSHQMECGQSVAAEHSDHQSIMLIMESPQQ